MLGLRHQIWCPSPHSFYSNSICCRSDSKRKQKKIRTSKHHQRPYSANRVKQVEEYPTWTLAFLASLQKNRKSSRTSQILISLTHITQNAHERERERRKTLLSKLSWRRPYTFCEKRSLQQTKEKIARQRLQAGKAKVQLLSKGRVL